MKKLTKVVAALLLATTVSSCATVFGGPVSVQQRTNPVEGQPGREVSEGALIADVILSWPSAVVDFATGAIYKPQPSEKADIRTISTK